MSTLTVVTTNESSMPIQFNLNRLPDTCPMCNHGISPIQFSSQFAWRRDLLHVLFRCPRSECQEVFIATYVVMARPSLAEVRQVGFQPSGGFNVRLEQLAPRNAPPPNIPDSVKKISQTFVTILGEVAAAESDGLHQLVGIGLRKALEFLIFDFAISEHKDKEAEIKAKWLADVIKKYIPDPLVQQCAERASWLGNDHTHYTKKYEDRDITDLKTLVRLTVNWIDSHLLTKQFVGDMPGK